jgi:hypothetical protein
MLNVDRGDSKGAITDYDIAILSPQDAFTTEKNWGSVKYESGDSKGGLIRLD